MKLSKVNFTWGAGGKKFTGTGFVCDAADFRNACIDQFDLLTASGYKLDLITGKYEPVKKAKA